MGSCGKPGCAHSSCVERRPTGAGGSAKAPAPPTSPGTPISGPTSSHLYYLTEPPRQPPTPAQPGQTPFQSYITVPPSYPHPHTQAPCIHIPRPPSIPHPHTQAALPPTDREQLQCDSTKAYQIHRRVVRLLQRRPHKTLQKQAPPVRRSLSARSLYLYTTQV